MIIIMKMIARKERGRISVCFGDSTRRLIDEVDEEYSTGKRKN